MLGVVLVAYAARAHEPEKEKSKPGDLLRRLVAQMDSGTVDSTQWLPKAYVDTIGPRRIAFFTREDLALPAPALRAVVDSAVSAGATDILVDVWSRATVPYYGSAIARPDSTVAGGDPLGIVARAASDARVRAWLYLSDGFTVWESPLDRPDEGPFIASHRGMAAVDKWGKTGLADSAAGVWRYAMSPQQLDVHKFLFNMLRDTMSRYPTYGVALDGIEFPSDDVSFDKISMNIFINVSGVDPRGLDKTDLQYNDWVQWRTEQMRVFPSSLYRAMRRTFPDCSVAWFVRPASERDRYLQDWPLAVNRHMISWLAVRPGARTGDALRTYLAGTHKDANGVPWGLRLDASLPAATLADQIGVMRTLGGKLIAAPAAAFARSSSAWKALWSDAPPTAPAPSSAPRKKASVTSKKR